MSDRTPDPVPKCPDTSDAVTYNRHISTESEVSFSYLKCRVTDNSARYNNHLLNLAGKLHWSCVPDGVACPLGMW